MNDSFKNADNFITHNYNNEQKILYNDLEEKNIFIQMLVLFTGKHKWIMILMMVISLIVFGLFIFSVRNFINSNEIIDLIKWGGASFFCILFLIMMKIYSWMQIFNNNLLRELKRLELQITYLLEK